MVSFGGVNLGRRTFVPDMQSLFAAGSARGTPRDNCSPQCRCSDQGEFEAFLHGEVDACRAVDTMHLSVGKGAALDSASVTRVPVMATAPALNPGVITQLFPKSGNRWLGTSTFR